MTLVFHSTTIHKNNYETCFDGSSVIFSVTYFEIAVEFKFARCCKVQFNFSTQYFQRNVTTRCKIARDLNSTVILDLLTNWAQIFHKCEARVVDFLCFLRQKRARERFALGPITETERDFPSLCDIWSEVLYEFVLVEAGSLSIANMK